VPFSLKCWSIEILIPVGSQDPVARASFSGLRKTYGSVFY